MSDYFEARYRPRLNRLEIIDLIKQRLNKLNDDLHNEQLEDVANDIFDYDQIEYNAEENAFIFNPHGGDSRKNFREIKCGDKVIVKSSIYTNFDKDFEAIVVGFRAPKEEDNNKEETVVVVDSDEYVHDCDATWLIPK